MAAFELHDTDHADGHVCGHESPQHRRVKEERIIALKVYDNCRRQNCLTPAEIGPARAAEQICIGEVLYKEGEVIKPPHEAASVTVDRLKVKKIIIAEKQPCAFKNGYWDIDIKFVFAYALTFRDAGGGVIMPPVKARSIFNMKATLFGSVGSDLVVGTDLMKAFGESATFHADPFVMVEAKAVALHAQLQFHRRPHRGEECPEEVACEVWVTIGLFSIIQLFRLVNLSVESRGFDIPGECEPAPTPISPCALFEDMDFPMDIFAPPQKPEFSAGLSLNIPPHKAS